MILYESLKKTREYLLVKIEEIQHDGSLSAQEKDNGYAWCDIGLVKTRDQLARATKRVKDDYCEKYDVEEYEDCPILHSQGSSKRLAIKDVED